MLLPITFSVWVPKKSVLSMNNYVIKTVWLKASVLGCLWASSEIVLGSFLHNLKIPFSSNLLTGIGIILLVSAGHIWHEKGLIWRSGLICALMKTLSPSAVIFGPMISILSEALLIEMSVIIFRRSYIGWIVGGALAMSWNLAYMIFNKMLFYGMSIIDIYTSLIKYLENQLKFTLDSPWYPFFILLGVFFILGIAASVAGIFIGKKIRKAEVIPISIKPEKIKSKYLNPEKIVFNYSLIWLTGIILMLPISILTASIFPFPYALIGYIIFILLIISRYKQALNPMKKVSFIVAFFTITFLTSMLLGYLSLQSISKGFYIGLTMNIRATAMIMGFAALGAELKNPFVKKFFHKRISTQLILSLEIAVETLPLVIRNLPDMKSLTTKPFSVLSQLMVQAQFWLDRLEIKTLARKKIVIITGKVHTGKTTCLTHIVNYLNTKNVRIAGFISPAVLKDNVRQGFDLLILPDQKTFSFSRIENSSGRLSIGQFIVNKETLDKGLETLNKATDVNCDLVVIDEIGPWELENQGWTPAINKLMKDTKLPLIWVVRREVLDAAISFWAPASPLIIDCSNELSEDMPVNVYDFIK